MATIGLIPNSRTPALGVAIAVRLQAEIARRIRELEARHRNALTPHERRAAKSQGLLKGRCGGLPQSIVLNGPSIFR
jgi:hypothetical protein